MKYPLVLSDCNQTLDFFDRVSKNPQILRFMKKLVVAFHNFAKAPNKKREKSIFELNAVIGRPRKIRNSVQRTYSHDFNV